MTERALKIPILNDDADFVRPMGAAIPRIAPVPVVVFPESTPGESYAWYRHDAQLRMRAWVQRCIDAGATDDEHTLWKFATGRAVDAIGRGLNENEAVLVTRTVRDMWNAHEALRVHRLSLR